MKRGKKYLEAANQLIEQLYMIRQKQSDLQRKQPLQNLMRLSKFTFVPDVTDVTQISRSVVQLYYHTELVKL